MKFVQLEPFKSLSATHVVISAKILSEVFAELDCNCNPAKFHAGNIAVASTFKYGKVHVFRSGAILCKTHSGAFVIYGDTTHKADAAIHELKIGYALRNVRKLAVQFEGVTSDKHYLQWLDKMRVRPFKLITTPAMKTGTQG